MKMKIPFRKQKETVKEKEEQEKETQEKLEKERKEFDLDDIGLGEDFPNEPVIEIQRAGSASSGYIDQVPMSEIKDIYGGSIHEYLKQRFGAGDYLVTVRKRNKRSTTRRIKISGDSVETLHGVPTSGIRPGDPVDSNFLAMWTQVQSEKARLEAELEHFRTQDRNDLFGQIATFVSPLIQTLVTRAAGNESNDPAGVINAAMEALRGLAEIREMVAPASGGGGKEGSELGQMIAGIGLALENINRMRQGNLPNDVPSSAPTLPVWPMPAGSASPALAPMNPQFAGTPPSTPWAPTPQPTPQPPRAAPTQPINPTEPLNFDDMFMDIIVGMVEQKQTPKLVAEYIMSSLQQMEQNIGLFEPQVQLIIRQAVQMPIIVWDYVCGSIPELAADARYTKEIRAAIEALTKK